MNKKILFTSIITLTIGLFLGWLIFKRDNEQGNKHSHLQENKDEEVIWTCSMHPQIRQKEKGICPICNMDLIPLDVNSDNENTLTIPENVIPLMDIQTSVVGNKASSSQGLILSGKITIDETATSSIVSHIPGRIEKLYIGFEGEMVAKGQRIASIYSPLLITAQKDLLEAYKMKSSNPKLYEATVNKLKFWKITDKQIETILQQQTVQQSFDIYSDHSGIISKKYVSVGDHLKEGGLIFELQNINKLWVEFDVYEYDLSKVKIGDLIEFITPSLPDMFFTGKINFIDPIIHPETRTTKVRLEIINRDLQLKPGMFVEGILINPEKQQSEERLVIPKSAVLWTGKRSVVYVKLKNRKIPSFEYREIVLGKRFGDFYEVTEGLSAGDEVVTNGAFVIDAAAQLNNSQSMMNKIVEKQQFGESFPDYRKHITKQLAKQIDTLLHNYFSLKDGFVKEDKKTIKTFAEKIKQQTTSIDLNGIPFKASQDIKSKTEEIHLLSDKILNEKDLNKQRQQFKEISDILYQLLMSTGSKQTVYFKYCPMAFDNEGAYWLSPQKEILNPYFGDKMLHCGNIKKEIK